MTRCCTFPNSNIYTQPLLWLLWFRFLPACLSASPSCPNPHLGEQARCHADSGTQRCQGLAAAPYMILVRPPCQPKRSSGITAHFIIFFLMTPPPAARRRWWWVAATCHGTVSVWCTAFVQTAQTSHESFECSYLMRDLHRAAWCCLVWRQSKSYIW